MQIYIKFAGDVHPYTPRTQITHYYHQNQRLFRSFCIHFKRSLKNVLMISIRCL